MTVSRPEVWSAVILGEVADVFNGKTPSKDEQRSEGHPVLKIKDVSELGEFRGPFGSFVDASLAASLVSKQVRLGDVLILNAAHNAAYVGSKIYRARQPAVGALATGEWLLVRPFRLKLDAGFIHHWMGCRPTRTAIRDLVKGIHLYPKDVARLQLPLPPLAEQQRIADILDRADALRAKRRAALALLDTLTQVIFVNMFGGAEGRWPSVTIGDVASPENGSIRTGPFGSQLLHGEFTQSGVAVLGIDNAVDNRFRWAARRFISDQKYASLKRYTVNPGDVIITIMGTCGRCAIVPDGVPRAINTKHLCCITLDRSKCLPEFLHAYFLRHPAARRYLEQKAKGAIMAGLNMGIIKAMPIPLVPIEAQEEFARRVAAVDKLQAAHRASLAQLDALFASLQHRAFRGEL